MTNLVQRQLKTLALLLSFYSKVPLRLVPDPRIPSHLPQVFRLLGEHGNLSKLQRQTVIVWFMENHPQLVRRWWNDAAKNILDMNLQNELYIHEQHLESLIMVLHPQKENVLEAVKNKINTHFSYLTEPYKLRLSKKLGLSKNTAPIPLVTSIQWIAPFIHFQGPFCNDGLIDAISALSKDKTGHSICFAHSSLMEWIPLSVQCLNPDLLLDFCDDLQTLKHDSTITLERAKELAADRTLNPNSIWHELKHRHMTFLVETNTRSINSITSALGSLNHLLKALDLPELDFLPAQQVDFRLPSQVQEHPGLSKTNWHTVYAMFTQGDESTDLLTPLDTEGEPEWVTQARRALIPRASL